MSITIEKVSYTKTKDARILESVLNKWFKDPKDLNLTDPRMSFPFKYKKWVAMTYANQDIKSFVLKSEGWIVGIGSLMILPESNRAHALHIFIDKEHREQGLGRRMMEHLESLARKENMKIVTLRVMPKNEPAIILYEKLGYIQKGTSKLGSLLMEKVLV